MNPANILSKTRRSLYSAGALALILSASTAQAAVSITSVVNGSAAPVLDSSYGTMELAFNLGSTAGGTLARDGITFTNNGVTGTTPVVYGTANGITATGSSTIGGTAISNANLSGADALYYTESWTDFNRPMTLTLTGLDALKSYRIQVMHGEPRALLYNNGNITATGSSGAGADSDFLTFGNTAGKQFALVTIEVSGSTSLAYFMPTAFRGPSIAGVTVQSVPEPSVALLGGFGLLALVRRRR